MRILKHTLTLALTIFSLKTFAQYHISGNIKDISDNEPLVGASIYIPGLKKGVISDHEGYFTIGQLKKGNYLIEISFSGFKSFSKSIDLKEDTFLTFNLHPSATELSEIIVTGVTRATELKRNPVIITKIDKTLFSENSANNLVDALKNIPGVNQITTGSSISKPIIRGLGFNRIITLNNGIKQEGQQWGDEHGIEIDEYAIDGVEIIKGPGSLLYGSDGIGGVLNFLPPKAPLDNHINTQILSNYQSNNNLIGYSIFNSGNKNNFQWSGRFSNKHAGNYKNNYDGKVYNSGFKEINGNISLGINKAQGHSFLNISSFNTQLGIVEGERDSLGNFTFENKYGQNISATKKNLNGYQLGVPYQKINHLGIVSNNLLILNKGTINIDIGYQNNQRKEFEEAEHPDDAGLFLFLNTLNYNLRYNFEKIKGWETSLGMNGMYQTNNNKGDEFLIPDYNLFDIGGFIYTQKSFHKLSLAGGLRIDNRNINTHALYLDKNEEPVEHPDNDSELKFSSIQKSFQGLSGSVGLSYQISPTSTLKFNFSNGFRAPNIAELSSNGKHEGTFRYEIGNEHLKPEFSHQLDLAYYLNSEHVILEVSPFVNLIENFIFLKKLKDNHDDNQFPSPQESHTAFEYTSGTALLAGGEFYLDIHPHPLDWLHIENAFSYVNGFQYQLKDSSRYLPFIPAPKYKGGIKTEFKNIGTKKTNLYFKFNVDYYFPKNNVHLAYGTETATPGYTLINAGMGVSIDAFKKKDFIQLHFHAENIANKTYQSHLSRLKYAPQNPLTGRYGVFNMGRNFSLKMIVNI